MRLNRSLAWRVREELHDARLREEAGVIAELLGKLLEVGRIVPEPGRDVKAMEVRNVENFPPELQAVLPLERQNPALAQAHVPTGVALSANNISRAAATGERVNIVISKRVGRI